MNEQRTSGQRHAGVIRFDRPSAAWEEAYPIGNGKLAAMVFGDPRRERLALNEDSVWYGGPSDRNNPDALAHLGTLRQLIAEGRIREAQDLAVMAFTGVPESQRHYQPLGDLGLNLKLPPGEVTNYSRELDLSEGIARVEYRVGNTTYARETFASFPDNVIVVRLTSSSPGGISLRARLTRGSNRYYDEIVKADASTLVMRGNTGGKGGLDFRGIVNAVADGGSVKIIGEYMLIEQADSVTLLVAAATSFRHEDPEADSLRVISLAAAQSYETLKARHISDFRSLMDRVDFNLAVDAASGRECDSLSIDLRLKRVHNGASDIGLVPLYYQFGRYLLVSGSRPGSLPLTLQGKWNDIMLPPWDSKYTININTEMNYWPAESGNLAECHEPLFDMLERMREPGRRTARVMYGCRGFMSHHNTDIWGDTAPQDIYIPATFWTQGAAWLSLHLWEHYVYGTDREFLERAYPTMKEAAEFYIDFLIETKDGLLVTSPSVSPENTYILPNGESGQVCMGPSMDSQILHELFTACIEAAKTLGVDDDFADTMATLRSKLPQPVIGKHGQLLEWLEEYEEAEPGHRHISHLFALHPGTRFTVRETPEWTDAARVTLERRLAHGGGHTGWSRAWIINMWARLEDGEKAYENVVALLSHSTLPNMLDNHPPFQIDGNFGGAAGIAEMLVQSHAGAIHLLPALPSAWQEGSIAGIRARNGFEVDVSWRSGQFAGATIRSTKGGRCVVLAGGQVLAVTVGGREIAVTVEPGGAFSWQTVEGCAYVLHA
ncbi:glycosyl hydrolase family 95 catalytic domain-containing protein [Cohnella yongneupensis]|uniref:Glycoside hydrolase N-terminal domain-containing protein n=1 Tax=Cohnella yongneupensis TaxID=425006 RepID=A0ABW0R099_9BACL